MGHSVTGMATIEPFTLQVDQTALDDLHRRLADTRWPDQPAGADWSFGPPVDDLRELAEYWRTRYDWRSAESEINSFPQFTTEIDGQNVHFLHVRSPEPDALPLILTHGWPGSIMEFLELIGPLTDPVSHGGNRADAFHLVVPTIPGFTLSGVTTELGWTTSRMARAWAELMRRLGYDRYVAHGGDWGAAITRELGLVDPGHVMALHVLQLFGATVDSTTATTPEEQRAADAGLRFEHELGGYASIQSTRPQLIAYGLTDSPVAQLSWIVDIFEHWTDSGVDRDALLTNVALYWLTGTAGSSARIYRESAATWGDEPARGTVPTAVAQFPHDNSVSVRRIAEQTDTIARWTTFDRGGHFPGMETPDLLVTDLREFFTAYR